jgi:membrane fusion protein, multidrug efflux system
MQQLEQHDPRTSDRDEARHTESAADAAKTDSPAVFTHYDPDTGGKLKKAALIFVVVLVVGFLAVRIDRLFKDRAVARAAQETAGAPHAVDTIEAKAVGAVQRFSLPGQTAAWHASTIYARVNGYVGKWFVDIGDHVHAGQVLALIETPELDAELAGARAQLQAADAQVLVRRSNADFAKTTYDRWRDSPQGVVSEQEREEKHADYDSAMANLRAAEAEVTLDQARVNQYTALSQFKKVTAPFDGVISQRDIDIGNLVTAGSTSATTPLYVMQQNDPMRIFVEVPQRAAADLMGDRVPVEIQTPGGEGHVHPGSVTRTSDAINVQARTLRVEVDIPNAQQTLVPGMYVRVAFGLKPKGLVEVPAAALIFRSGGPQVARVDRSGKINFRNVTIARDDGNVVELGSGVEPGDELALNVSSQIGDGDLVTVHRVNSVTPTTPKSTPAMQSPSRGESSATAQR